MLAALLGERSELRAEVERLAATLLLEDVRVETVAAKVRSALADLERADLAVRAGRQPEGGYVQETDAAYDLVAGSVGRSSRTCVAEPDRGWTRPPGSSPSVC